MEKEDKIKRRNKFLKITAVIFAAGIAYIVINHMFHMGIPCVFYKLFKIKCAGCGMTRATVSLLSGDIQKAFSYNAIFFVYWFEIISVYASSGVRYIKSGKTEIKGLHIAVDIFVIAVVLIYGIIRLFFNI